MTGDPVRYGGLWVQVFPRDTPPCELCGCAVRDHTEVWLGQDGAVVKCSNRPEKDDDES